METSLNSQHIVRLLADDKRRKIVAALVLADGAMTASGLGESSGLSLRDVVDGVDRLLGGGLVEKVDDTYLLVDAAFQHAARAEAPSAPVSAHADQPEDIARVLDVAFKDGRLVQWPSKRTKRLIVLDRLAQEFEPGRHYSEREVNRMLRSFDDDVAALRRYLVDERFLDRGDGTYWRSGGSVDV